MNELQIFNSPEFGEIRITVINDEPFLMLNDVCKILDIGNPSQAKTRLKENGVISNEVTDNMGRTQQATFINESNLYKLIFQSRKPEAEKFSDWVTEDVIPAIRKHGGYLTANTIEEVLSNPDTLIRLATDLKREREERTKAEALIQSQKPKVLFADAVSTSKQSCLIGELAKVLKQNGVEIGQNRLFEVLRREGYLGRMGERYNLPTQRSMELGLMEIKKSTINQPDGSIRVTTTTKITGKGQVYFINKFLDRKEA